MALHRAYTYNIIYFLQQLYEKGIIILFQIFEPGNVPGSQSQ